MTTTTQNTEKQGFAAGAIFSAGVLLLLAGLWQAFLGLVALFKDTDTVLVVGQKWIFQFDVTTWGWIHLLIGAALFVVGIFVLRGALWAGIVGIGIAGLSAFANFLWLPYYPVWAILIITLDVIIIWALAVHRESIHILDR
jgi:hypothetical protein